MTPEDKNEPNYFPIDSTSGSSEIPVFTPDSEAKPNTPATPASDSNIVSSSNGSIMTNGTMQSPNFSPGASGWQIDSNGNVEFGNGKFRGDITGASGTFTGTVTATSGTFGGFTLGADYIKDTADSFGLASTVTGGNDVRIWAGDTFANRATAPLRAYEDGSIVATNINATGAIYATSGWIGAATALVYESQGINTGTTGWIRGGQTGFNTGIGYFLGYYSGQYVLSIGNPTTGQYMNWDGTNLIVNDSPIRNDVYFGDGSDGDVTISGDTTLTSDMFYNNLTIATTKTLNPGGYRIFVKGTLTFQGTGKIGCNGGAGGNGASTAGGGAGGSAGSVAQPAGTLPTTIVGRVGGAGKGQEVGQNGATTDVVKGIGVVGAAGGKGGNTFYAGGSGGIAGAITGTIYNKINNFVSAYNFFDINPSLTQLGGSAGSGSGGGGGGDAGGVGGGGGGSGATGGIAWVCARKIVTVDGNTYIQTKGGAGGNGGDTTNLGSGGGGAGGAGGVIILTYSLKTGTGTTDMTGGAKGLKGAKTNGSQGDDGNDGTTGKVYSFIV